MEPTRVLVVDDNAALAKAVQRYLAARGCDVRAAGTVADARRLLAEQAAEILFVDYSLPDGTGAEIVRWGFEEQRIGTAYCVTGVAISANVVQAMRAGCRDVLEKPFDLVARAVRPQPHRRRSRARARARDRARRRRVDVDGAHHR